MPSGDFPVVVSLSAGQTIRQPGNPVGIDLDGDIAGIPHCRSMRMTSTGRCPPTLTMGNSHFERLGVPWAETVYGGLDAGASLVHVEQSIQSDVTT